METSISKPHAVLISNPGLGHLIPVLELGKRIVTLQNFEVTIFVVASQTSAAESEMIQAAMSPKLCQLIEIPPPDISHLVGPDTAVVTILAIMMRESKSALRAAISTLKSRPTAMIFDLFGTESFEIADELEIPKYYFVASHAWFLALTVYTPILDKLVQGQYVDQTEPFDIPGCKSLRPEEVIDPMLDRTNQQYFEYVRMGTEIPLCDGILINTWEDLQPKALAALRDDKLLGGIVKAPIYTVGPIVRSLEPTGSNKELFDWLDKQPSDSVLYVSLGSGGTLSCEQTIELAWGLELSQQRFIWVVRRPAAKGDGSFFTVGSGGDDELSSFLPEGFLNRINEVGKLVPKWAPQVNILNHPSVGGFLSHSGWNSIMESISNGVPMIAWPLYAEQRMNATLIAEELGVAVRPKIFPSKRVVGREEIMMMVRRIMVDKEGHAIRDRAKELKHGAEKALSYEGGSIYDSLSLLANKCKHP
ncbi:anthocyanidin 3-O-glucosyltransferase 5-like [Pistacia vera]|uniref:anthocyanidin 3-O-glucosyltransferase 5-like n=1 Tax=Pistacia vera TaxID=55513 RepID=UPI001263D11E|nr:anthocyanidin 3-O-glucosyltransferase 5-like [Pistacia vera]